ncbi:hypothetical protein DOM21_04160 [Bacteriovorax stolpii]|uniref:hypothetical protein n=1 Tax=Bacteriovorax stolpii TaxID=960 RepID=UPI0011574DC1|nr:hypothetical protein [Bacteriovorax stolpii]QDK40661.1 hypothetical protein DOM21_04160 [Bacteriovorax stolpii]
MHFLIITLTLFLSFSAWAKNKSTIIKEPSQILPLNEEADRALRSSPLASDVVEDDANQKEFHRKAFNATKKIDSIISIPEGEHMHFVYDCLFMQEEGLYLKYSHLPKDKVVLARKMIVESFK